MKVNDIELTEESLSRWSELIAGGAGTKVRLAVRHAGSEKSEVIELTKERFVIDPATGEQLYPLRAAVNERLNRDPSDAGLLELRAELAGQWSDVKAQLADYSAAIAALSQQKSKERATDLKRLYRRRGMAYVGLEKWQYAVDDFAHVVTDQTTDDVLLSNQVLALANALQPPERFVRLGRKNESNGIGLVANPDGATEPADVEGQECRQLRTDSKGGWPRVFRHRQGFQMGAEHGRSSDGGILGRRLGHHEC